MPPAPLSPAACDGTADLVAALAGHPRLGPQLAHVRRLPAVVPRYGDLTRPLPEAIAGALARQGIGRLWSHQAEALEAARAGADVLVTTPTASGKSLVFQLPVLEAAANGETGRALFLFPLKALGQDQRAKFEALAAAAGLGPERAGAAIYDGDTPREERERIRAAPPRVVVTNPDMLHLGLLGSWPRWTAFFAELEWIVLDELHTYRGVFGSHFHHVLQRLLRVVAELGARPRLIASSATAANAADFAAALTGRPFHAVAESGAPREGRHFLLFRPAASPYSTALDLTVALLAAGLKTIVFTKARRITELLYSWLRRQEPRLGRRVASYRAGFLAEERRRIERALFEGRLDGVISTSALEMGIDIGGLDACVLVGFPGSVMATWQRSGRVGRAGRESLTALVPLPDALDQYWVDHPDELLGRPLERLLVDPDNEPVAAAHLACAAAEKPLSRRKDAAYLERHAAVVGELLRRHRLAAAADGEELYARERRPHAGVNLRGTGASFAILARPAVAAAGPAASSTRGTLIGTVDGVRVFHECHPGAVYLHAGRSFLVRELDVAAARVAAEAAGLDYYTTPLVEKQTEILEVLKRRDEGALAAGLGRLRVTERVIGFERKRMAGQELLDQHGLELPPVRFETVGLWWTLPAWAEERLAAAGAQVMGSLHAAEHAAISLFPLFALCDRGDIGGVSLPLHPQLRAGAVFVYDGHPGGIGIAARGFEELPRLLARVADLLASCPCDTGCPACVQSPKCGNGNRPLDKAGAERLLRLLLAEPPAGARAAPEIPPPDWEGIGEERAPYAAAPRLAHAPRPAPTAEPAAPAVSSPGLGTPAPGPPHAQPEAAGEGVGRAVVAPSVPAAQPPPPGARPSVVPAAVVPAPAAAVPALDLDLGSLWGRRRRRAAAAARPRDTVLFDLETRRGAEEVGGWKRSYRMLVAVGVVLHLEEGRFEAFREEQVGELIARLEAADLVVGFNIKRFDYQVLAGYTGIDYERRLRTFDLLEEIHRLAGRRIGLNHLARETLGTGKSADGLTSLEWVRQGRLDEVEQYCRHDVELLRDLYLHGRRMGYLCYRDRQERRLLLPVDW